MADASSPNLDGAAFGRLGTVVVLNGPSTSGKSSLARALQARWGGLLLDAGLDLHLAMLPRHYLGPLWSQVYRYDHADNGTFG